MIEVALCAILLWAAVHDYHTLRLPDFVTLGAACFAIVCLGPQCGWEHVVGGAAAGYMMLKSFQLFMHKLHGKQVIGSGDAKLMLSIGALVGGYGAFWVSLIAVVGAIIIYPFICQTSTRIPFGPFLVCGTYVYLFMGYCNIFYLLEHVLCVYI